MTNEEESSLFEEIETCKNYITNAIATLQNGDFAADYDYDTVTQLLQQGFEKLLKNFICIAEYEKCGRFPNTKDFKSYGHKITKLLYIILEQFYDVYNMATLYQQNKIFLTTDENLIHLLMILSDFGSGGRYYHLDKLTKNPASYKNHVEEWELLRKNLTNGTNIDYSLLYDNDYMMDIRLSLTRKLVIIIEKFISAIIRQYSLPHTGLIGNRLASKSFSDFMIMANEDFGKTDYRLGTDKFKNQTRRIHLRTQDDEFERNNNPNYKSIKISRDECFYEWPFYSNAVVIECREKHWVIVTIDGKDYALNGAAKGKYKLESPHEAGMAILGVSVSEFIKIGLTL